MPVFLGADFCVRARRAVAVPARIKEVPKALFWTGAPPFVNPAKTGPEGLGPLACKLFFPMPCSRRFAFRRSVSVRTGVIDRMLVQSACPVSRSSRGEISFFFRLELRGTRSEQASRDRNPGPQPERGRFAARRIYVPARGGMRPEPGTVILWPLRSTPGTPCLFHELMEGRAQSL